MQRAASYLLIAGGGTGILLTVLGVIFGFATINGLYDDLSSGMEASINGLDSLSETLDQTDLVLTDSIVGLQSVVDTLQGISGTIDETGPIFETASDIAASTVPDSLDIISDGVGNLQTALVLIDGILTRLANVEIDLPGFLPAIRLGILYNPEVPIYEPVGEIRDNLDAISTQLRELDEPLTTTRENLTTIGTDVDAIATNASNLRQNIGDTQPLVADFNETVKTLSDDLSRPHSNIERNRRIATIGFTLVLVWVGLLSAGSLLLGVGQLRRSTG